MKKKDVDRILLRVFEDNGYNYTAEIYMKNGNMFIHDKLDGKQTTVGYYAIYKNNSEYKHYISYENISTISIKCKLKESD